MRFSVFAFLLFFSHLAFAQILDDENITEKMKDENPLNIQQQDIVSDKDDDSLFFEMFQDHKEELEKISEKEKKINEALKDLAQEKQNDKDEAVDGDLEIGVTQGSFSFSKTFSGKIQCDFSVTLKNKLNKKIKKLALRLVYPHRSFAFIFFNVTPNSDDEHFITTSGDICYNLGGVPDINIDTCRIKGVLDTECAQRIRWSNEITKAPKEEDKK